MRTFAGIATLPGREASLKRCVQSLVTQVDDVGIVWNGHDAILATWSTFDYWPSVNRGSSSKMYWASHHGAIPEEGAYYLACDDDLEYPPDYVERMLAPFQQYGNGIIVTACGRTMKPTARNWSDYEGTGKYIEAVPQARWINYLGGCAFAFHTSLGLPTEIEPMNEEEAVLSVWAQRQGVPIYQIARPYDCPKRIDLPPGTWTLYEEAKRDSFRTRSEIIRQLDKWTIHTPVSIGIAT